MIIYPPLINEIIPAFKTDKIIIPFTQNPGVTSGSVRSMLLRYKSVEDKNWSNPIQASYFNTDIQVGETYAEFNSLELSSGYYYFQLAYHDDNSIDNLPAELKYSNVSVGKCLKKLPTVSLNRTAAHGCTANYSAAGGVVYGEYLYSYRFDGLDAVGNIIETSNEIISIIDTSGVSYEFNFFWENENIDQIKFTYTTINGYTAFITLDLTPISISTSYPTISLNTEEGYIKLSNVSGYIERTSVGMENEKWETLGKSNNGIFIDYTPNSGQQYYYRFTLNTSASNKRSVSIEYDNIFLQDKDKILKIQFNPKVSSYKETVLETKQDTIGGQYPIFYRNGAVKYKEIPISGLISYLSDDIQKFMIDNELGLTSEKPRTTNLTGYNINAERLFREEVLSWLNNGKPKLFRSPTEGIHLVRLMNITLSPNDTVGRMLWTFNATAYEIANCSKDSLKKYGIIE